MASHRWRSRPWSSNWRPGGRAASRPSRRSAPSPSWCCLSHTRRRSYSAQTSVLLFSYLPPFSRSCSHRSPRSTGSGGLWRRRDSSWAVALLMVIYFLLVTLRSKEGWSALPDRVPCGPRSDVGFQRIRLGGLGRSVEDVLDRLRSRCLHGRSARPRLCCGEARSDRSGSRIGGSRASLTAPHDCHNCLSTTVSTTTTGVMLLSAWVVPQNTRSVGFRSVSGAS